MSNQVSKLPPQAKDLEDAVIGEIMLEKGAIDIVIDILKPESFYDDKNAIIYSACLSLKKRNEVIDILTVTQQLQKMGQLNNIGGAYRVTELTNRIASAANVEYHARIVQQKFIGRELIRICNEKANAAYDDTIDVLELLDSTERDFKALQPAGSKEQSIRDAYNEMFEDSQMAFNNKGQTGYYCHIPKLNEKLDGFVPGLYIIGARPSIGKSSLIKSLILSFVKQKIKCKIFSLEVKQKITIRSFLAEEFKINSADIKKGRVSMENWQKMEKFRDEFLEPYLEIDHTPAINIHYLRKKVKKFMDEGGKLFAVDYIQLMKVQKKDLAAGATREQEISFLSSNLKEISSEFNVPIIAAAQLGRKVEDRETKRPEVSDLREGGSLEQDADAIILISRPEHYGIVESGTKEQKKKKDFEPVDLRGKAMLIVAKQRDGAIGDVQTRYIKETTSFEGEVELQPYGTTTETLDTFEPEEPIF